jgi:type II secretory pathway pseudopilin PulG
MSQRGATLLEVVVSVLLLAVALVPLLQLYPPLLSAGTAREEATLLGAAASGKLEELAQGLRGGAVGVGTGTESCAAPAGCRLSYGVQQVAVDPLGGWLRHAWVVACVDSNGNGACDPGEAQVRYETRVTSRP